MASTDAAVSSTEVGKSLQANVARPMEVDEPLARQVAALDAAERAVRGLALRETRPSLEAAHAPDEPARPGEFQARTNADFRRMRETHAIPGTRTEALPRRPEAPYAATFAPDGTGRP